MDDNIIKLKAFIASLNGKIQKNHPDDLLDDDEIATICENIGLNLKYHCETNDACEHRWYEENSVVYNVIDKNNQSIGFIESSMVTKLYSEHSSWEDIYHILDFCIVEPYTETITVIKFRKV